LVGEWPESFFSLSTFGKHDSSSQNFRPTQNIKFSSFFLGKVAAYQSSLLNENGYNIDVRTAFLPVVIGEETGAAFR